MGWMLCEVRAVPVLPSTLSGTCDYPRPDCLMSCSIGTDSLPIPVTPTPESFPRGKLSPMSPTWPFSEVQSSSAADRTKAVLGPSPDNTSWPQSARTPLLKTHRRARAHGAFPSSPYQGGGRSASLEPSEDSAEPLVHPRPQGGREAAALSGLPHTSMLPPLSTVPPGMSLGAVLPSRPPRVGTPSIPKQPSPKADASPSSSSSLAPSSPHSILFPKPAQLPTKVPVFRQPAPTDPSSSRSIANPRHPLAEEMNGSSPNAQDLVSIPRLGLSGSSAPAEGPHAAGSPMPEFLSSVADLTPLSPPPLAPGSLLLLPGGTPSSSISEVAPSPASTQLSEAEVPARAHKAASLRAFRSTATRRAASSPVQTAASVVVEVTSRTSVPATAHDSFHSLHLSAAPENYGGPSLSAEHTSPPLVPSPLPRATARPGQESLSGAVLASPSSSWAADFPSTPALLQPAHSQASPSALTPMPAPQEAGQDASPPAAATDFLLSSPVPTLPSTTGTFSPQEEDSMTAILKISKKAALTAALQTLPSQEGPSLRSESRLASDLSTDHVSRDITPPRRNLLPSAVHPSSLPLAQAPQTVSASLSFSSPKPETHTAAMDRSQWPVSASKQGTAFPSSSEVSDFSTMGDTKKPAITDVSWSSLSTQAGSLPAELTMSDVLQQTNYDVRGHTINSTSWGTHSASVTPPSGLNSSVNTIKFQDFKDNVGHSVTAGGSRFQDPDSGTGTSQAVQQSDASTVGNRTDFLSVSTDSHSRDFQMAGVEESESHPHLQLPAHPAHPLLLTSPSLTSAASWQEMLSDGMDPSFQISGDISPSLEINASTPFQNIPRDHSAAESPPLSSSALFRTPSKALLASQRPEKWTGAASHAGSLFPGTHPHPQISVTASVAKASSSSTQIYPSLLRRSRCTLISGE